MRGYPYKKEFPLSIPGPWSDITFSPLIGNGSIEEQAKIDTGADTTMIPDRILTKIKKYFTGKYCSVTGYNGKNESRPIYHVNFEVGGQKFFKEEVISSPGKNILLGRNILNQWKLTLDGPQLVFQIG